MKRDRSIDLMKCILVIGMIIAHVIQLLGKSTKIARLFLIYINMITFAGFLFCFGYVCNIVYMQKEKKDVASKFINNSIKMLIAFYVSGVAYKIFVSGFEFSILEILKIIVLWDIPGYSEFLLSFALINLITYILFNQIKYILVKERLIITIILLLMLTFIPYQYVNINQIGLIIGSTKFASFPVLQYGVFYLMGMFFQDNSITFKKSHLLIASMLSSVFIIYYLIKKELPSRFPPSLCWILSPSIFIYGYYIICKKIIEKCNGYKIISIIGENTLYFLISSNIIIFVSRYFYSEKKMGLISCLIYSILIIVSAVVLFNLMNYYKKNHDGNTECCDVGAIAQSNTLKVEN